MNTGVEGIVVEAAAETPLQMRTEEDWMALFANVPVEDFAELGDGALATAPGEDTSAEFFEAISSVIEDKEMMADMQVLLDTAAVAIAQGHAGCMEEMLNNAVSPKKEHIHVPGEHETDDDEEDEED